MFTPIVATLAFSMAFATGDAAAEAKKASAPALELVDVFSHTGQALVYDQTEAEYVLLRAGSRLRDFKVGSIRADEVELYRTKNARLRYVITKPSTAAPAVADAPIDPYASAPEPEPEAEPAPEKINQVRAPVGSRPENKPSKVIVTRRELDRALDNLDDLSREVEVELVAGGTRVSSVGKGTLPYRLGLRRGDVIVSIAGVKTARLEDGADVFVKLSSAKKFKIELIRDKERIIVPVLVNSLSRSK